MGLLKYVNPIKYFQKAQSLYYDFHYDSAAMWQEELKKFAACGFNYAEARKKLDAVLRELNETQYELQEGMASIHWILFACLALKFSPRRILEVGTFDGQTTRLLCKLFPMAEITTVDLPDDDPIFKTTYGRNTETSSRDFTDRQRANTSASNVRILRANSFFLPGRVEGKFDLIWVDGGHLYPEIAWDICNAYHLCEAEGYILCDDIIAVRNAKRDGYVGPDSYETLQYMVERTGDEVTYFLKRNSALWSGNPRERKYVAVIKRMAPKRIG